MHRADIKAALQKKGWSLAEIANSLGLSRSAVSMALKRPASLKVEQFVANILGKSVDKIFAWRSLSAESLVKRDSWHWRDWKYLATQIAECNELRLVKQSTGRIQVSKLNLEEDTLLLGNSWQEAVYFLLKQSVYPERPQWSDALMTKVLQHFNQ